MPDRSPASRPSAGRGRPLELVVIGLIAVLVPLGLRPIAGRILQDAQPSYLPALETFRDRLPYDPTFREDIRTIRPEYVFIGDSMLGSRIDPTHMTRTIHRQTWWVMQPGTGSAWWYLAFKNHVLGAEVRPKAVIFFFRDYNLTDLMFRLDDTFRWSLDTVAGAREPELNRAIARCLSGAWYRVHRFVERSYQVAPVAAAADRWLREWPVLHIAGIRGQEAFQERLNAVFSFEHLRPMKASDLSASEARRADFEANLRRSILPEILALGREHDVQLAFVRVQRRPEPNGPPHQSEALRQYVSDLAFYLESQGAVFHDDTGDPDYTLDWYKDGDHTGGWTRRRYTELFAAKVEQLFE
jgi:hypothetical protein